MKNRIKRIVRECIIIGVVFFTANHTMAQQVELPDWFFELPISENGELYFIGISDPDMSEEDGYNLALFRAKSMASLHINADVKVALSNYSKSELKNDSELDEKKYENGCVINSKIYLNDFSFYVSNKFITKYNETILLLNVIYGNSSKSDCDSLQFMSTKFIADSKINGQLNLKLDYSFLITSKGFNNTVYYKAYIDNDKNRKNDKPNYTSEFETILGITKFQGNGKNMRYKTGGNIAPALSSNHKLIAQHSTYLNNGLWYGYISNITDAIEYLATSLDINKIKSISETYPSSTYSKLSTDVFNRSICTSLLNQGVYEDEKGNPILKTKIKLENDLPLEIELEPSIDDSVLIKFDYDEFKKMFEEEMKKADKKEIP